MPNRDVMSQWAPEVSGQYAKDCETGRQLAGTILDQIRAGENPTLLGHLVKSMIERGGYTGVEVGFFQTLSEELIN